MKYYDLPDIPSAHNMVFDIWYELGLIGIIALLSIISIAARMVMYLQAGSLLVTMIMMLGTIVELSVDHRIWLSWVQGALILTIAASVLASKADLKIRSQGIERPPDSQQRTFGSAFSALLGGY
jgi:O-antigen ligase